MKGYVFAIDAAIAVIIAAAVIAVSYSYSLSSFPSGMEWVSAGRIASDAVAVMHYNGTLQSLNEEDIESALNSILPENLYMSMRLDIYKSNLDFLNSMQINQDMQGNHKKGRWFFMVFEGSEVQKFAMLEYKVGFR